MKNLYLIIIGIAFFSIYSCEKNNTPENNPVDLNGWICGSPYEGWGTILYTNNGGDTWVRQASVDVLPEVMLNFIMSIDKNLVWACGDSINGEPVIVRTKDGGQNWMRLNSSQGIPATAYIAIDGVGDHAWALGGGGIIIYTSNQGESWTRQDKGLIPTVLFQSITVVDRYHVWAVGEIGSTGSKEPFIYYTSDGGQNWFRQGIDTFPGEITGFIDVHAISKDYCWVVGEASSAYATENGGQSWYVTKPPLGIGHNNGVCIADHDYTWVATDYSIANFYSKPSNLWTSFHLETSQEAIWPVVLGVTMLDKDHVWMVTGAGGDLVKGEVFYTENTGQEWIKQEIPVISYLRRVTFAEGIR